MNRRISGRLSAGLCALALTGCMVAKQPAPVVERTPLPTRPPVSKPVVAAPAVPPAAPPAATAARPAADDPRPDTYTVKRGDTLYGIGLDHGQDYRDIARWNNIADPNVIEVGQVLRVRDPATARGGVGDAAQTGTAVTAPLRTPPPAEGREVASAPKPLPDTKRPASPPAEAAADAGVISSPRATKLPFSEAALAKLRAQAESGQRPSAPVVAEAPAAKPDPAPPAAKPEAPAAKPEAPAAAAAADDPDAIAWAWPAKGTVVANFNDNGGLKGLQIAGEMGQAVLASAGGRVVYTGSGIRGYGNLVIIKHNNTYLSAYAHNRAVLVKQGDNVARGQKIAEMGDSDASRVMLHFEIRRLGRPVDPARFLPPA